jgi:hypothetical protein
VHTEFDASVRQSRDLDRVVEVLRVVAVDREDRASAQVDTALDVLGTRASTSSGKTVRTRKECSSCISSESVSR